MTAIHGPGRNRRDVVALGAVFVVALVVGAELARPFRSASIAFDSQVAVLHFERIMAGRHLESFVATTPKPLLTILYGLLHWITGGWDAIAWATLGAYAVAGTLAAVLAWRLAGGVAGAFSALAVLASPGLLFDVGYALATPWAAIGWAAAGLALTAPRPRYVLGGLALLLATLARLETVVPVGIAGLALAGASLAGQRTSWAFARPPGRAWLVPLVALLAIPVMMIHDVLLTGDPLFWASVAGRYSAATRIPILSPVHVVTFLVGRYWASGTLTLLALVGLGRLARTRGWPTLVGLLGLGPGIAAFLVLLAIRGIFVSARYAAAIDVAVAFAAGIGAADLASMAVGRLMTNRFAQRFEVRIGRGSVGVALAVVAAVLVAGPYWRVDPGLRGAVHRNAQLSADEARAVPAIARAIASVEGPAVAPDGQVAPLVYAPTPVRPRVVLDLGLTLSQVGGTDTAKIDVASGYPPAGIVFHSLAGDGPSPSWKVLEISVPTTAGSVLIEPLLVDARAGFWVLQLRDDRLP